MNVVEKLKYTLRHNWTVTGRQESVAEHSWRMIIFFFLIKDLLKIEEIDSLKMVKMMAIHDIPEVIDGDVPGFEKKSHHYEKEIENAREVFDLLPAPRNQEYLDLIIEFEEGKTAEAKLAKALDKIETQIQHLNSGPEYWCKEEIGEHMLSYPNAALEKLGNKSIDRIWRLIEKELKDITNQIAE